MTALVEMLLRCEEQDPTLIAALEAKQGGGNSSVSGAVTGSVAGSGIDSGAGSGSGSGSGSGPGTISASVARSLRDHLVAVVVTIAVFCEAHPPFSARHLTVLLPYLKGNRDTLPPITHHLS